MFNKVFAYAMIGCIAACSFLGLMGCSTTPKDKNEPIYYTDEAKLPNDAYYIVRTEKVKTKKGEEDETRYYPLYTAETVLDGQTTMGFDPTRIVWTNKDIDDGKIPTMYKNDKLIYKSQNSMPEHYTFEKFFDNGYTIGIAGLRQDLTGNYRYYGKAAQSAGATYKSYTMSKSDATGVDSYEKVEGIYLAQVGDQTMSPLTISASGTVKGLEEGKKYKCDIRLGSKKVDADMTANVHLYTSAETYKTASLNFITPTIAEIPIPEYLDTGYYEMDGAGFFRFVNFEPSSLDDWKNLTASDYNNDTIFTYNENGVANGTSVGYVFDENDFLVKALEETANKNSEYTGDSVTKQSYNEYMGIDDVTADSVSSSKTITNPTSLEGELLDENSKEMGYSGEYTLHDIGDPIVTTDFTIYVLKGTNTKNGETLDFRYTKSSTMPEIKEGETYLVSFAETKAFDGYKILSAVNGSSYEEQKVKTLEDAIK